MHQRFRRLLASILVSVRRVGRRGRLSVVAVVGVVVGRRRRFVVVGVSDARPQDGGARLAGGHGRGAAGFQKGRKVRQLLKVVLGRTHTLVTGSQKLLKVVLGSRRTHTLVTGFQK
jgi:hypothetical protein